MDLIPLYIAVSEQISRPITTLSCGVAVITLLVSYPPLKAGELPALAEPCSGSIRGQVYASMTSAPGGIRGHRVQLKGSGLLCP